ncbi:hypothetical protein [Yoonia sp. 2307UL14-13]|uniref:hypothetical protein n=1 Tax=Yoonia sp. 2307UL14-13 TaxID=3126506 RepID=UPI0030B78D10
MFDHVEYTVTNIHAARALYGTICQAIGTQECFFDAETRCVGFGTPDIVHILLTEGPATTPPMHICFAAADKTAVETGYNSAIAAGGTCNGKPGYRPEYEPGYYAAFIHDTDGHNIEILYRERQTPSAS